ncbi:MAG: DUF1003 domain-containing protein [Hyphomonadaceae bacterium]|nr:DUF1003 domain-containing protein [Hyphomonadaceae bacterium]
MEHAELSKLRALRDKARERWGMPPVPTPAPLGFAERAADMVAGIVGSWRFILIQSALLVGWIGWNAVSNRPLDPYPFILLNLILSFQAAYTAPIIMMSQNRQEDIDRERSIQDFEVNQKAELEIELLHTKIDLLKEQEIARLTSAIDALTRMLEERDRPMSPK